MSRGREWWRGGGRVGSCGGPRFRDRNRVLVSLRTERSLGNFVRTRSASPSQDHSRCSLHHLLHRHHLHHRHLPLLPLLLRLAPTTVSCRGTTRGDPRRRPGLRSSSGDRRPSTPSTVPGEDRTRTASPGDSRCPRRATPERGPCPERRPPAARRRRRRSTGREDGSGGTGTEVAGEEGGDERVRSSPLSSGPAEGRLDRRRRHRRRRNRRRRGR